MPTMHTLCYNSDAIAPTRGSEPEKNITQNGQIGVSGVLRPNYGVACLLLLVTFALDELAVYVRLESTRTHPSGDGTCKKSLNI